MIKTKRLDFLDSLRGFAAIFVMLNHFYAAYDMGRRPLFSWIYYTPLHFFYIAPAAVSLFFVLSGYVLALSLNKSPNIDVIPFYVKRVVRIWPTYLAAFALSYILYRNYTIIQTSLASTAWIRTFWRTHVDGLHIFKQLFLLDDDQKVLVPQSWSLRAIMQFSLLIPFLYFICKKTNNLTFLILNLVLYFAFRGPYLIFHFSLGVYLAVNQQQVLEYFAMLKKRFNVLLILATIVLYTYNYNIPVYYRYILGKDLPLFSTEAVMRLATGLGSFFILLYCLSSPRLQKALSYKPFVQFGKLTYGIYVTHFMVLLYAVPLIIRDLNRAGITNRHEVIPAAVVGLLVITTLISYLIKVLVEQPFLKLEKRILNKKAKQQQGTTNTGQQPEAIVLT
ncbi:MAG: acyltransferase [Mucilaginibacter sp.]